MITFTFGTELINLNMKAKAFLAMALGIASMTASAQRTGFYGTADGVLRLSKQFEIGSDHTNDLLSDRAILKTGTTGAIALGAGYEFNAKVINRVELEIGIDFDQQVFNEQTTATKDGQIRSGNIQLSFASARPMADKLMYVPKVNLGFALESPWFKGLDGEWHNSQLSRAPYLSIDPIVFEYQAGNRVGVQLSMGQILFASVKTQGIDYRYYTAAINLNSISARMLYRF